MKESGFQSSKVIELDYGNAYRAEGILTVNDNLNKILSEKNGQLTERGFVLNSQNAQALVCPKDLLSVLLF